MFGVLPIMLNQCCWGGNYRSLIIL